MEKGDSQYFMHALSDFTLDAANGGAIRHLADLGFTVPQIMEELDYPASKERVADVVWRHYLETGKIRYSLPKAGEQLEKVSYEKVQGKYGRTSLRRVVERSCLPKTAYIACDFGRRRYQDETRFLRLLSVLDAREQEYVCGLPWPLQTVYHVADGLMGGIAQKLGMQRVLPGASIENGGSRT